MSNDEGMTKPKYATCFSIRLCVLGIWAHFVVLAGFAVSTLAEPAPTAKDILESVRMKETQQRLDLQGQLRQNDVVIPFQLIQDGNVVRYIFSDPEESLQLVFGDNDSELEELSEDGVKKVARFDRRIRDTDITYEDLSLKFLYWPDATVVGSENVRTRNCWKLELRAPSKQSQYSKVLLWIDKNSGALMRMEGYDADGRLAKKFEVISAQKIDNRWFLKQMRIESLQSGTNKVQSRTYLEIKR
jgi:Outer membrane lipoprotein-sorting protein